MLNDVDLPELADRTHRFRNGAPHAITVGGDGARVAFLRSAAADDPDPSLWVLNVATAAERLIADPARLLDPADPPVAGGIRSYAVDATARIAAFDFGGRLFRADLQTGEVVEVATEAPVTDPRPDPTGQHIGYVDRSGGVAALRVVGPDGTDELLAGEPGLEVGWGVPEPVAEHEFGRTRGWWWAPDGRSVLAARTDSSRIPEGVGQPRAGGLNAQVSLHLLDLDGGWVDVHWDRETYPYLVDVRWADGGGPLITVLRRLQQHGLVLSVDPRTGETQVHAELADARWVEPVVGTPRHLPDGRVLVGGELAHDGYDARCLFADGSLLTPPTLYVRRVVGVLPRAGSAPAAGTDLIVEGNDGDPGEQHIFRIRTALGGGGTDARRLNSTPGWHSAEVGGDVLVVGSRSLEHDDTRWTVWRGEARVGTLASRAALPPYAPQPSLERVTDRRLPAAVLSPTQHLVGRRLPVLVELADGPGHQRITAERAAWQERQWWADAGFAVVSIDSRGTPGIAPSFEKVVHRRLADVALTDHVDALLALTGKHPDLDLTRVAVRGTGLGGWLAALAVLRRPDLFRCAVVRDPVTDWTLQRTAFAERYLGLPELDTPHGGDVYAHHSLVVAAQLADDTQPMLLVQALADRPALPENTLNLSTALLAAHRPHAVLPLAGVHDLDEAAAMLLPQELDFIRRHLT